MRAASSWKLGAAFLFMRIAQRRILSSFLASTYPVPPELRRLGLRRPFPLQHVRFRARAHLA